MKVDIKRLNYKVVFTINGHDHIFVIHFLQQGRNSRGCHEACSSGYQFTDHPCCRAVFIRDTLIRSEELVKNIPASWKIALQVLKVKTEIQHCLLSFTYHWVWFNFGKKSCWEAAPFKERIHIDIAEHQAFPHHVDQDLTSQFTHVHSRNHFLKSLLAWV